MAREMPDPASPSGQEVPYPILSPADQKQARELIAAFNQFADRAGSEADKQGGVRDAGATAGERAAVVFDAPDSPEPNPRLLLMPPLLAAGLRAWILEQGPDGEAYRLDPPPGKSPAWHARLHRTLDESSDDEIHWAFRSIAGPHHNAVRTRVERVRVVTGLTPEVQKRKAFILRTGEWQVGPKTRQRISEFEEAGGVILAAESEDLSVFWALNVMLEEHKIRVARGDYNIAEIHLADAIEAMTARNRGSLSADRGPKDPYSKA